MNVAGLSSTEPIPKASAVALTRRPPAASASRPARWRLTMGSNMALSF